MPLLYSSNSFISDWFGIANKSLILCHFMTKIKFKDLISQSVLLALNILVFLVTHHLRSLIKIIFPDSKNVRAKDSNV